MTETCPSWLSRAFALLGGCGVALGAFGAHALKDLRSPQQIETWKTATLYLLVHAAVGTVLTLIARSSALKTEKVQPVTTEMPTTPRTQWVKIPNLALYLFFVGSLIFTGALYGLVLIQLSPLGAVAPLGGLMLISGWLVLALRLRTCSADPQE
ncbi:DUF423 domain-containing protein [bacterium]|nr:DUF423 domain-containing protein [bacterium]